MATKNNPGAFKCYEAALPDEEFFTALARDLAAPATVDFWCDERERLGLVKTEDDRNRINEARRVAQQMRMWRAKAVLDATANNEEPIWRQPRQIMDDGPPVCMGAMRDPITVKAVLTRLLDTTLDGLHHGVLGEVVTQIQEALTAIDRDTETVATPFEGSGAIQPHDYYIIGERSPLSYDALCVRLDRLDAIRLAAKKVHEINADLKEFDGDRRGIAAASVEAVEDMVKVVLEVCPDEGVYPADLKPPVAEARSEAGTVPVMTTGLIMVHGRPMDIREIENALAEEKLDEYRKRYPTPDYIWPGTELKPTLDTAPEDLAHAPEVPGHRFSTFVKHGRYAYARGLEIAPMHLPRALEAMAEDGWDLVSIFGATDSQNVGFIFQRGPATFDIPPMGDRAELLRRVRQEGAKLGESYKPSAEAIDLGRQQEP